MTGIEKLNELKAKARHYGIEYPKNIKMIDLQKLVDDEFAKRKAQRTAPCGKCGEPNIDGHDCFDDIDPEKEGDHLAEPETPIDSTTINREEWLTRAVTKIAPLLAQAGAVIDPSKIRVSVGFGAGRTATGVCFPTTSSDGEFNESFISPVQDDPVLVLKTLTHEMIHASDNCKSGHTGHFRLTAERVGMEGTGENKRSWLAPVAGPELKSLLGSIALELGPYPHSKMNVGKHKLKQKTYMLKLACDSCETILRGTTKVISRYDEWKCPCGGTMEVSE